MQILLGLQSFFPPNKRPNDLDGHCELQIGPSTVMFAKSGGQWEPRTADMFVYVENADETYNRSLKPGSAGNKELETSIQSGYWLIRKNHNTHKGARFE